MSRSPLFYPLNRGMDAEAGGAADLQTDVMRFIAILSLCLVAIFALVQSIPLMPVYVESPPPFEPLPPEPTPPESIKTEVASAVAAEPKTATEKSPEPVIVEQTPPPQTEAKPLVITRPAPQRVPLRRAAPPVIEESLPPPPPTPLESMATESATPAPQSVESIPEPTSPGFTLRFETDLALTRLVARNDVGLYAITPEKSVRMNVNRGALSFWAASVPNEFHEMDETTVPVDVLNALQRAGSVRVGDVRWGVTLPSNMRQQLDQYLLEQQGGSLVIGGDGSLRLER